MDIPLETIDVWQFEGDISSPKQLLAAVSALLAAGDIAGFGIHKPTAAMLGGICE
jgi:hypothetical protein